MDSIIQHTTELPPIKDLATALCKAQAEMEGAKKEATNPHFNRKYADLASVWSTIREPLTKNGLSVVQLLRSVSGGVEVETILLHSSGQRISDTFSVPVSKADAQGYGSAATYARRYSLMALVGVAPEDDDGNSASQGAPGSAGAGGEFRPAGRRPLPAAVQKQDRAAQTQEAERDGLTTNSKAPAPAAAPANGRNPKRIQWVTDSIAGFKLAQSKDALQEWWRENADRLAVVEEHLPAMYEKLIIAFDAAIEATAARAA